MKVFILLLAIAAAAVAESENSEAWCRCAAFVTYEHTEIEVYESPEIAIVDCVADHDNCKQKCADELNQLSNNGDLWYEVEPGLTIGQQICTYLAEHFFYLMHNKRVYGYYEVCGKAWEYTGVQSEGLLCCTGSQQEHCVTN